MDILDTSTNMMYIPESFQAVQQSLDEFVCINYETALELTFTDTISNETIINLKGKVMDIIRNNPSLASVPRYFHDGRADYLWLSDFYDEITKPVYQQYIAYVKNIIEVTPSTYVDELSKIRLPYFKDLVDLVSLEQLIKYCEKKLPKKTNTIIEEKVNLSTTSNSSKRSYEPQLTTPQYKLLLSCIEQIKLFRRPIKVSELKKLLQGKLAEPLQVTNQKTLVYLFDQLRDANYLKDTWMSIADGNNDFISFRTEGNKERYGDAIHYINMQQLLNSRNRNKRELIFGLEFIDDLIEELDNCNAQ